MNNRTEVKLSRVEIIENHPSSDVVEEGSVSYRCILIFDEESGGLYYEIYRAEYRIYDGGDAETGPVCCGDLSPWEHIGSGMGNPSLAQFVEEYEQSLLPKVMQ